MRAGLELIVCMGAALVAGRAAAQPSPVELAVDTACPDAAAVGAALGREGVPLASGAGAPTLRVANVPEGISITLGGGSRTLNRIVGDEEPLGGERCWALADVVAVVVARWLGGVEWAAPVETVPVVVTAPPEPDVQAEESLAPSATPVVPPPAQSTTLEVDAAALAATGIGGTIGLGPQLGARVGLGRLALSASAAYVVVPDFAVPGTDGTMSIARIPLTLDAGWRVLGGTIRCWLGPGVELEVVPASTTGLADDGREIGWALWAQAVARADILLGPRAALGLRGAFGALLQGHRFEVLGVADPVTEHDPVAASLAAIFALRLL